jgi:hypothetical protein
MDTKVIVKGTAQQALLAKNALLGHINFGGNKLPGTPAIPATAQKVMFNDKKK